MSVLQVHGTADSTVRYDDSGFAPGAEEMFDRHAGFLGCDLAQTTSRDPLDLVAALPGAETSVRVREAGCAVGTSAELWTIEGGSHIPIFTAAFAPAVLDWLFSTSRWSRLAGRGGPPIASPRMDRPTSALLTDHYELTMVASALRSGVAERRSVFEVFARRLPVGRAYGVVGGIDRVIDAVERFRFDDATVAHLVGRHVVEDGPMVDWLRAYRFTGDITGYAEGELFFPYSPVLTVAGSFAECVVLETVLLSVLNHDCAVASAAARMADAAGGATLIEGGSRRTDPEAAVAAARASHVGGFDTTSNLEAGRRHGIPTGGTTAHAFVLAHATEEAAFAAQRDALGEDSTYLVDTFDVMEGIRRAVAVVGPHLGGVRIDSGELLADSRAARALLDRLGATRCRIVVSSDLDEFRVAELVAGGAPIDAYLVGTSLVTGSGHPTAQMVYKLVAVAELDGPTASVHAVGKLSPGKRTIGGRKDVHRTVDFAGRYQGEVLSVLPVELPDDSMTPQVPLVLDGEVIVDLTDPGEARARCFERRSHLRPEDRTPWPATTPAIPTIWEGMEEPLSAAVANGDGGAPR